MEYLKRCGDGTYLLMDGAGYSGQSDWIEVPEGADYLIDTGENSHFYGDICGVWSWFTGADWIKGRDKNKEILQRRPILWQRQTKPEPLPFIDDEQSLNDQVATAEEYRQEIKIVEEYDPVVRTLETYRVLTGITMDEQAARGFIAVYELAKQLKG